MQTSSFRGSGMLSADLLKSYIRNEDAWRLPAQADHTADGARAGLKLARWSQSGADPAEVSAVAGDDTYTVGVCLRSTDITFLHDGRLGYEGRMMPGMFQVTAPGHAARAVFHSSCDVLHLFVPQTVLDTCHREATGGEPAASVMIEDPSVSRDPCIERLSQALLFADESFTSFGQMYVDSINLALVSRLLELRLRVPLQPTQERRSALPKWRLKRAVEFIDAHLADSIGLEDVAQAAGLTRMHFAAQFRAATGLRPHEYLLRRRIECAQQVLADEEYSLLDAAQLAGFRSQAHFTTVFKRVVGATPKRWRDNQHAGA